MNGLQTRILLVDLNRDVFGHGVRHLAAYLRNRGMRVSVAHFPGEKDPLAGEASEVRLKVLHEFSKPFDLIGLSVLSHHMVPRAAQATRFLKDRGSAPVVWGGVPVICDAEYFLKYADYVCAGEGEVLLPALAQRLTAGEAIADIPNLGYRDATQEPHINPTAPYLSLDSYPPCTFDTNDSYAVRDRMVSFAEDPGILESACLSRGYTLFTVRGCPFSCTYCCNNALKNRFQGGGTHLRFHPRESILAELEWARASIRTFREVKFDDDDFFARPPGELARFAVEFKRRIDCPMWCNGNVASLTTEKLDALTGPGVILKGVKLGLQSGSVETNKKIYGRDFDPRLFESRLSDLKRRGIEVIVDTITGNPFETARQKAQTPAFLRKLLDPVYPERRRRRTRVHVLEHKLMFYPGTKLYDNARSAGYIGDGYMEDVLFRRTSHAAKDDVVRDVGADWLATVLFNHAHLPIPAKTALGLLSIPLLYRGVDSRWGRCCLRVVYRLLKTIKALSGNGSVGSSGK